ncbi:ferric reductase-like transmembrane domain-containing protein, partial [Streptococcus suis]|uniref:ferric reductase-like transmembrane domain-containing protein n=1 Tax=Streptococcus suis TaxID=1307 RepID=UPI003CF5C9A2
SLGLGGELLVLTAMRSRYTKATDCMRAPSLGQSYGFLTALTALSIAPIRRHYYETFYVVHVICIIGFMVSAWLHHP